MNRHTVHTALGRVVRTTPSNITKAQCLNARHLSTTQASRSDESENPSGREKSAQAAAKLGQLVRKPNAGFRRINLSSDASSSSSPPRANGPVDARTFGARTTPAPGAKILNLRSLRAPGATGRLAGAGARSGGGPGLGRFSNREGGGGSSRFGAGARAGARPGASRFGKKKEFKKKEKEKVGGKPVDRPWSEAEMQVLDRLDQGEVLRYTPKVTQEDLAGYGPAVATGNLLGKVESALRAMRIMGGGRAFDNDPASTVDTREFMKRYLHEKKPIFLNTVEEKKWLEESSKKLLAGPAETIKEAVIESVIKGKYTAPEFKDLSDVKGLVANYHARQAAYRMSHRQEFTEKLVSILPQAKAGDAAAAAQK